MKVWILQTGEPLQIDSSELRPMRAINLSNALIEQGHDVTLWSSDFDHFSKRHRFGSQKNIKFSQHLTIRLIKSRGYKSHIGLSRLLDHAQLGWNLKKMLKGESPPDVAFIGYPPIEPAWIMSSWLKKNKSPFLFDIKDAWPDVLIDAFPSRFRDLARVLFSPYKLMMEHSLRNAVGISSISDAFLEWSLKQAGRKRNPNDTVTPLTSPEIQFSEVEINQARSFWDSLGVLDNKQVRVYFVGTLNNVFDFSNTLLAAENLGIQFVIAGDGPQRNELMKRSACLRNVIFPGWISSVQAKALAERSTFAIAPIKSRTDYEMSVPNKFIDAFMHGKPILSSLGGTSSKLLKDSGSGITFNLLKDNDLTEVIAKLISNPELISKMADSSRDLYLQKFEFHNVYGQLVCSLESLKKGL